MNTIERIIASHTPDFSEQPRKVRKACVDLVVQYLFRVTNYEGLSKGLRKHLDKVNVSTLLEHFSNKGYVTKHIKLWLFAAAAKGVDSKSKALVRDYEIEARDVNLGSMLSDKTKRGLKSLTRRHDAMTLRQMDNLLTATRKETHVWCRKFLNKKLTFIMKRENIKLDDLHNELLCLGFRGMYLMYPMYTSELHAVNIAKRTMRNQGMNQIQKFTTKKRGRADDNKTFYSNTITLSEFDPGVHSEASRAFMQESKFADLHIDVKNFAMSLKDKKKQTFVGLLMGIENQSFYDYLKRQKLLRRHTDMPTNQFIDVCLDYLQVDREKGYRFLQRMQQHFGSYQTPQQVRMMAAH